VKNLFIRDLKSLISSSFVLVVQMMIILLALIFFLFTGIGQFISYSAFTDFFNAMMLLVSILLPIFVLMLMQKDPESIMFFHALPFNALSRILSRVFALTTLMSVSMVLIIPIPFILFGFSASTVSLLIFQLLFYMLSIATLASLSIFAQQLFRNRFICLVFNYSLIILGYQVSNILPGLANFDFSVLFSDGFAGFLSIPSLIYMFLLTLLFIWGSIILEVEDEKTTA
jgi:hypothetical protein